MAAQQQGQQQGADNSLAMLWGIGLAFSIIWLLWYFFHDPIAGFILHFRILEMRCITWFVPKATPLLSHLQSLSPSQLQANDIALISKTVGYYLRYPVALILLLFALFIYTGRATLRFKKNYTIDSLVEAEKNNWVQINPVVPLDLVNVDIDEGAWAMSLSPLQFAKKHQLIQLQPSIPNVSTATMGIGGRYFIAKLNRETARQIFIVQLGNYWQGISSLSRPAQALFAIFAARAVRDREAGTQLLLQIARSANPKKSDDSSKFIQQLDFRGTDELIKKYINHKSIIQITQRHAYTLTVMAAMLQLARQDGVLASADFLWLKPTDRTLWFMLNSVGRQTAFPEVAGPFAHWIAERAIGQKLLVPMVDSAVNALEIALKEVKLSEATLEEL